MKIFLFLFYILNPHQVLPFHFSIHNLIPSEQIQLLKNESIFLESQKNNALMSKEDFSNKIDLSLQQYEDGKFKTLEPSMDVQEFLNSMCAE